LHSKSKIEYFGWSLFRVQSETGTLMFDPFFRPMHGAQWARLEDFKESDVICVTHGHYEHYLDTPPVVNATGSMVVSSREVCNHLASKYKVPKQKLLPIEPFQTIDVCGFKITAFEWEHRDISFWNFFKGDIITASQFVWYSLFRSPFSAPKLGYYVEGPGGLRLMNYSEGFNNLMATKHILELAERFKPNILLAGMQLNFEEPLAEGVAALAPDTVVLFHPHEKLFEKFKITSSPPDIFLKNVKLKLPEAEVIIAKPPYTSITIPKSD